MQALVYQNKRLIFKDDWPKPQPVAGEALVRVLMAGICNTDLEITRGYLNFAGVLGHEFVGVVEESSNPSLLSKRVVGEINCACGECSCCQVGLGRHCPQRKVLGIAGKDGAFAEYLTVPEQNLHLVADNVANQAAVFCEPLAAAWEILEQTPVTPQDDVLVLGDGKLGMLIAQVLKTTGCRLLAVGKHKEKLALFESWGIQTGLLTDLGMRLFDIVVDATGSPQGLRTAIEHTRPRGRIILKTTVAEKQPFSMAAVVINELTIIGSRCGLFPPALEALSGRKVSIESLISAIYPLAKGLEAFQKAMQPGVLKVLLQT
ncbi:MAG: alcohol dehydrogenase catalytic domain-containing protein [Candidatus Schekmanbacteria bacterium]|nr:alcohol dehydrogenase catalytic domain-containing protein [Candidatus Schekmanbacteria bacterium]